MPVPFIRCLPGGKRVLNEIARDPAVELKAAEFIDHAGRFLTEIRTDGLVHLMAIIDKADGCIEVAHKSCENGPELLDAVDALIEEAYPHIPIKLFVPANKNLEIVK
jgi:hypothetical protein